MNKPSSDTLATKWSTSQNIVSHRISSQLSAVHCFVLDSHVQRKLKNWKDYSPLNHFKFQMNIQESLLLLIKAILHWELQMYVCRLCFLMYPLKVQKTWRQVINDRANLPSCTIDRMLTSLIEMECLLSCGQLIDVLGEWSVAEVIKQTFFCSYFY